MLSTCVCNPHYACPMHAFLNKSQLYVITSKPVPIYENSSHVCAAKNSNKLTICHACACVEKMHLIRLINRKEKTMSIALGILCMDGNTYS